MSEGTQKIDKNDKKKAIGKFILKAAFFILPWVLLFVCYNEYISSRKYNSYLEENISYYQRYISGIFKLQKRLNSSFPPNFDLKDSSQLNRYPGIDLYFESAEIKNAEIFMNASIENNSAHGYYYLTLAYSLLVNNNVQEAHTVLKKSCKYFADEKRNVSIAHCKEIELDAAFLDKEGYLDRGKVEAAFMGIHQDYNDFLRKK